VCNQCALNAHGRRDAATQLLNKFRSDINSVLFGTESFWQGVDVPGEALSSVIITRLPFGAPTQPLLEARLEEIARRGGSQFLDYQVPEAVLKFKQGVGRLIRSKTDLGSIVILDPRVLTKPYGKEFLLSIPACRTLVEQIESPHQIDDSLKATSENVDSPRCAHYGDA
jgi:ATP-dependent DNA helicase DinG